MTTKELIFELFLNGLKYFCIELHLLPERTLVPSEIKRVHNKVSIKIKPNRVRGF